MELISKGVASYVLHLLLADLDEDDEVDAHKMNGIFSAIEAINNAPVINQWVSVEKRLPERDVEVLCVDTRYDEPWYAVLSLLETGFSLRFADNDGNVLNLNEVTHWMPLPEPPEKES